MFGEDWEINLNEPKGQTLKKNPRSGGFFLSCEDFWESVRPFIPRLRFFFFFLYVEISSRTFIRLLCQDQSIVAQRAETTVTERSLTSCV